MAVNVFDGKPQPVLNFQHRLLTRMCQLDVCAGLNRAQAHTSSMFGVIRNTNSHHGQPGPGGLRKDNASIIAVISAVLLE